MNISTSKEWLEADGLGAFASGPSTGIRTRRYHALLLAATTPPTGRVVLVNGFDAWVKTPDGIFSLSSQRYSPDVISGDGAQRIEAFGWEPWPHWIFKLENGTRIELEIFTVKGQPTTCVAWKLLGPRKDVTLHVRPFLSGRDYHSLHKSNSSFRFEAEIRPDRVSWRPYLGIPGVTALTNGAYSHEPNWYYNFLYAEERARGLDCEEDLAAPGVFSWNLAGGKAVLLFTTSEHAAASAPASVKPTELFHRFRDAEQKRREKFQSRLDRAADAYIVKRGGGKTIVAGYPWFTDWGRDTLIALRGLCLATGRLQEARDILVAWSTTVSEGMLPNRFPDRDGQPEFNSVDASLWYIIAAYEYMQAARPLNGECKKLLTAIDAILNGYHQGTRYGIRADGDGLLACGAPGLQLTWMDAKVGDWVVTPRIGKPVEVQALWLNALWIAAQHDDRWKALFARGRESFRTRFWDHDRGCLYDVIDVNHQEGAVDATLRPSQIFAVGGLPLALLEDEQARLVVEAVEDHLVTPLGLRSLGPEERGYTPNYTGGVAQRDGSYHQGTAWPWLMGPFVEAWVRVRRNTDQARREARQRFLEPLLRHLEEAGLGHISEIADAEPPHTPRGCPFQAWSVGEVLRLDRVVLAQTAEAKTLKTYEKQRRKERRESTLV
ncbi:MAG: amylo-alpha-1,6-glucosidase [Verrucomicrobia subdivision 3 bacterium]|nr:amylo-alpha-1,6-glucosidase [Limisphaerales bacterium]